MHLNVLALDFDGTLSHSDQLEDATRETLERARAAGLHLLLVTGRMLDKLPKGGALDTLFDAIVAEDGAVVYFPKRERVAFPFGHLTPALLQRLNALGVPLEHGLTIVATHVPHDAPIANVLREMGGGAALEYNRGAVMVMPPGATKGSGLKYALGELGYSPRNVLACGDAENDVSLFEVAELAAAVANASDGLKALADVQLAETNGAGVRGLIEGLLAGELPPRKTRPERRLRLGKGEGGTPVYLDPFTLLEHNLGVVGGTRSGKSWFAGLLAEEMLKQGYQLLIIDPEGDYRELRAFAHLLLLGGEARLPSVADVVAISEHGGVSLVLDLSLFSAEEGQAYVSNLLRAFTALRARRGVPHWVLFDEVQNFCPRAGSPLSAVLDDAMRSGGFTLVSYRPSLIASPLLERLDRWLVTRLKHPEELNLIGDTLGLGLGAAALPELSRLRRGEALLLERPDGERQSEPPVLISAENHTRKVGHVRHLHKYLLAPLPPSKRFYFCDAQGHFTGVTAASLWEFSRTLETAPIDSLTYHLRRGDFERWLEDVVFEPELAQRLRKIAHRAQQTDQLRGGALRRTLVDTAAERYEELEALI